ncbi:glucose-6-phosphate dehydrogenase [Candidatus Woesearchaeota archaeon]|nr:MAG: glucose-6-phosphate dehydrogenase [Candidatus Woesearchaeota archaeon]
MKTAIVLFGATGDLAQKKLLPSLKRIFDSGELENTEIICTARSKYTNTQFRNIAKKGIKTGKKTVAQFLKKITYIPANLLEDKLYEQLKELDCENMLFYLSVPPRFFGEIASRIGKAGLSNQTKGFRRIILEKPFGEDLKSARKLNKQLLKYFKEEQIYRIDHYLGKELIQDIMVLRFSNTLFERVWSNLHIDHVQITMAESGGIGERAGYYDKAGALKDVVQNHLLQVLCLVALEPPTTLNAEDVRDEKVKVLRALDKYAEKEVKSNVVRGQYTGYHKERGIAKNSETETYVALKTHVHNLRWGGVPFYIRTGKKLKKDCVRVHLVFKDLPCVLFCRLGETLGKNRITIDIQPNEGISIQFNIKTPGHTLGLKPELLEFCHSCKFGATSPLAYDHLISDALAGDPTLFTRWDEVEHAWQFIDQITKAWKKSRKKPEKYSSSSMGPKCADELIRKDGREWID